jgi:Sushi repeat (SCR repeat)
MKEMKLIPLLFVIVIPISGVVSQLQCSFPGIPVYATAFSNEYEKITWENRRSFSPGEHVTFHCQENAVLEDKGYEIICRNNGTWNRLPPICRKS